MIRSTIAAIATLCLPLPAVAQGATIPVAITVQADRTEGALPPVWRFFGADEPNYATMKDGRKLLVELGKLRDGDVFFRAHNLLNTGDGTASFKWGSTNVYTEAKDGTPVYDWTNVDRIVADGVRGPADIGTIATRTTDGRTAVLVWHYHDDDVAGAPAAIRLAVKGLHGGAPARATIWRVDEANGNAFSAWKRMGSPLNPDATQYAALEAAATMRAQPLALNAGGRGAATVAFVLPRQGVVLVVLEDR